MTNAAFVFDGRFVYYDSIIAGLAIIVFILMSIALYTGGKGRLASIAVFFPVAIVFSFVCSRVLSWYCHQEQFSGVVSALTRADFGGYSMTGIVIGAVLAGVLLRIFRIEKSVSFLFDSIAPAGALSLSIMRLSELFNSTCRSKIVVSDPSLQTLPFASAVTTDTGVIEYRFATFFVEGIVFFVIFIVLLFSLANVRKKMAQGRTTSRGNTARLFLCLFSIAEMVTDSTRNDAFFFSFNAFISMVQITGAVCLVGLMIYAFVKYLRFGGFKVWKLLLPILFLALLGGAVYCEYLVQRHGNWFVMCYSFMTLACVLMVAVIQLTCFLAEKAAGKKAGVEDWLEEKLVEKFEEM